MAEIKWNLKGRLEKLTDEQRLLLGAIIGLCRVCDTNEPTENTNMIIADALLALRDDDVSGAKAEAFYEKVREEKFTISPGCRYCASPCGRSGDFDLDELRIYSQSAVRLKSALFDVIMERAEKICTEVHINPDSYSFMLTVRYCLFVLGEDFTDGGIYDAIEQLRKLIPDA